MFTYIIWSPQGEKPPTVTFTRRWAAESEAKRLSLAHPNQVFHVCKIKSATVAGQSAYFGKWRPNKSGSQKRKMRHYPECNALCVGERHYLIGDHLAVSEADLIDEQSLDMLYRLGMVAVTNT